MAMNKTMITELNIDTEHSIAVVTPKKSDAPAEFLSEEDRAMLAYMGDASIFGVDALHSQFKTLGLI